VTLNRFSSPTPLSDPAQQRRLVKTARRQALRWAVRAVLLAAVAGLAFRMGWVIFGTVFLALTVMSFALAHSVRRRAAELAARLKAEEPS
jgi:uncharacterized membrane protein YciS (DUF1049 family)